MFDSDLMASVYSIMLSYDNVGGPAVRRGNWWERFRKSPGEAASAGCAFLFSFSFYILYPLPSNLSQGKKHCSKSHLFLFGVVGIQFMLKNVLLSYKKHK